MLQMEDETKQDHHKKDDSVQACNDGDTEKKKCLHWHGQNHARPSHS